MISLTRQIRRSSSTPLIKTRARAIQEIKNSNKQRGDPLPSELARLLDLEVDDIKYQGGRLKNVAHGDIGKRSVEIVGKGT